MTDRVVSTHFPYVPITFVVRDRTEDVEALLDTGFTGHLVVPAGFLHNGEPPDGSNLWTLADGSKVRVPFHVGTVQIGNIEPIDAIIIELGDEPIVGLQVTDHFVVTLDHGERLVVEP